uniref:Uncharacterized protein n=1 Tax=Setaria digitata TaxID=48799 RepID=A0A915Q048_9BILA
MDCLYGSTIIIALWNILYSILQVVVFAWQARYLKNRQWEFENRQISAHDAVDGFQARYPGLYGILTETPEKRRINALFALAILSLIVALMHTVLSLTLLYGTVARKVNFIWPWFFTAIPIIVLSTTYSVIWWTGDVFDDQLVMSVTEFITSLAVNSVCSVIVLLFFLHLKGGLRLNRPVEGVNRCKSSFSNVTSAKIPSRKWNMEQSKELTKMIEQIRKEEQQSKSCMPVILPFPQNIRGSSRQAGSGRHLCVTVNRLAEHNRMLSGEVG